MSTEYTPTTEEVRDFVTTADAPGPWSPPDTAIEEARGAAFDRWLAAHDRAVKAEALREAADLLADKTPYDLSGATWLRARADQIEGGRSVSILFATDHPFEYDGETQYCQRCELLAFMHITEDEMEKEAWT